MTRRLALVAGALLLAMAAALVGPSTAVAQTAPFNDNPIDWTVVTPFVGALGDDIPLRVGQDDVQVAGLIFAGFGERHIIHGHGEVPPDDVIDDVLQSGTCVSPRLGRFVCTLDEAEVVFVRDVDPRSEDDLPVGIITAYFRAPDSDE